MRLSVVVPTLDEAQHIEGTLAALSPLRALGHEVIVADGGSLDATVVLARTRADHVVSAPRGRATQMNAGAAIAQGDVLLFLHADTRLPPSAASDIEAALATGRKWGRFDVTIAGQPRVLQLVATMINARSRITGVATGDQGIFVARQVFAALGGYPSIPLMEDVALSKALRRRIGRPACLTTRVVTSGRRWEQRGPWRTIVEMWRLRLGYWLGADPHTLARRYPPPTTMSAPALLIFAKDPVPGTVKTRLASSIGATAAAQIYSDLVERTLAVASDARRAGIVGDIELCCAPDANGAAFTAWRDRFGVALMVQQGDDLGARMQHALNAALARGVKALLIGTDSPPLDSAYLAQAAGALATHDAVFGPAEDGGYVLVGLSRPLDVFDHIAWSTPDVMTATRARLIAERATWRELPTLWDVDTPSDLARFAAFTPAAAADHAADYGEAIK